MKPKEKNAAEIWDEHTLQEMQALSADTANQTESLGDELETWIRQGNAIEMLKQSVEKNRREQTQ